METTTTITLALEPHHMLIISHAQKMVCELFKLSWKQEGLISSMPNMQQSKGLHFLNAEQPDGVLKMVGGTKSPDPTSWEQVRVLALTSSQLQTWVGEQLLLVICNGHWI